MSASEELYCETCDNAGFDPNHDPEDTDLPGHPLTWCSRCPKTWPRDCYHHQFFCQVCSDKVHPDEDWQYPVCCSYECEDELMRREEAAA